MDQVRMAQSPHARSEAHSGKRSRAPLTFRVLALADHHLLFNFYPAPSFFSLSRYIPAPVRVVERIIDLPTNPQVVQKHREGGPELLAPPAPIRPARPPSAASPARRG